MESLISGAFAKILEANRHSFNVRFAETRHQHPSVDPAAFRELLCSTIAPIVDAVNSVSPERAEEVAQILYDMSLDLLSRNLLGQKSRQPAIAEGWRKLYPQIPRFIAASPQRTFTSITNALYHLSVTPGARPHEWTDNMSLLSAVCVDVDSWLQAGQIAAWRAGLAHYRRGALNLCRKLDPPVAYVALGIPDSAAGSAIDEVVTRLAADPWLLPGLAARKPGRKNLTIVARAGTFRGLGGLFVSTPTVTATGEDFLIIEGDSKWLLTADIFGATWHHGQGTTESKTQSPFSIDQTGIVKFEKYQQTFPELTGLNSFATNTTTLAVTTPLSFSVYMVALVEEGGST